MTSRDLPITLGYPVAAQKVVIWHKTGRKLKVNIQHHFILNIVFNLKCTNVYLLNFLCFTYCHRSNTTCRISFFFFKKKKELRHL